MTTITIERELLEQAIGEKNVPLRQIEHAILALRAALAAPATAPEKPERRPCNTLCELCVKRGYSFCANVAETTPIFAYRPEPAADDRHRQELLAMEITLQNMAERHAQELCAYQITVDKLRAERKPMTDDEIINLGNEVHRAMPDDSDDQEELLEIVRAVEAHHGIGEKP